jgi:hypothetical protein
MDSIPLIAPQQTGAVSTAYLRRERIQTSRFDHRETSRDTQLKTSHFECRIGADDRPFASNEAERLNALHRYDILDTGSEEGFDDITLLASQICGDQNRHDTALVDPDRQWV